MNAAYQAQPYHASTAVQCAMAFARGCVLPNDIVTAFSLIEGGKVVQNDDSAADYVGEFDRQFMVSGMDEAFYMQWLINGLNDNLPRAMDKKNEHSLQRQVKAAVKAWRRVNPGAQPTQAQVQQWIRDADAVNFDLAVNIYGRVHRPGLGSGNS